MKLKESKEGASEEEYRSVNSTNADSVVQQKLPDGDGASRRMKRRRLA